MPKKSERFEEICNRILEIVNAKNYRPLKPKGLVRALDMIAEEDNAQIRTAVKYLVVSGQITYGASHLIKPGTAPASPAFMVSPSEELPPKTHHKKKRTDSGSWIIGSFRRSAAGPGFVRPRDSEDADSSNDIFIPPHLTHDATTGDVVAVELLEKKKPRIISGKRRNRKWDQDSDRFEKRSSGKEDRGPRGKIVEIIERTTQRFVGTYYVEGDWGYVQVDSNIFNQPITVGDPSATTARPDDKVVIEMLRFPTHYRGGEAVVVEVLGTHGTPGLDTLMIIREFNLPEHFSEATLRNARDEVEAFFNRLPDETDPEADPQKISAQIKDYLASLGRRDLTNETIITIDPFDARDFDDAISIEPLDNGNWLLGVHIADVSHFVKDGSHLDTEAKDRGTSVYLPDRVIPMLPEVISNSLASLQPNRIRFTKSVFMEFTDDGIRCDTEIYKSAIHSAARLNYDEVQDYIDELNGVQKPGQSSPTNPDLIRVAPLLEKMYRFAMVLRERRMVRGSLEMSMPDIKIDLDADGKVAGAHAEVQSESHQLIEEFMLAANEAVAEYLQGKDIAFLRRVHKAPTYRKLKQFTDFLRFMGLDDLSPDELLESRFAIQDVLMKTKGKKEEAAVNFSLLRAMQRAVYTPEMEGHYALASPCYCHFTSPIRRYPDLIVHRILDQHLASKNPVEDAPTLFFLGAHCSERERRAEDAERELVKLKLIDFMGHNIGMQLNAVVTGVNPSGVFVQGLDIPAEGLIPLSSLTDDNYRFDRATRTISGRRTGQEFRLGDRFRVQVLTADIDAREINFTLIERIETSNDSSR